MSKQPLALIAYEAYCNHQRWISFHGDILPPWNQIDPEVKEAWEAAMEAVLFEIRDRLEDETEDA